MLLSIFHLNCILMLMIKIHIKKCLFHMQRVIPPLSKIVCIYYNSIKKTFHLVNIFQMHIAKSGQQILTVNAQ